MNQVLKHAAKYVDNVVILDDCSDDDTVKVCKEMLKDKLLLIVSNPTREGFKERELKIQQWNLVTSTNPDWILSLDADEQFEDKAIQEMKELVNYPFADYYKFRLYDFWNENHYREDGYWIAHKFYGPFLIKYNKNFNYKWSDKAIHSGHLPYNIGTLMGMRSNLRLKHLGWMNSKDRQKKYKWYKKIDPDGKYGIPQQYESILDENPTLIKWKESEDKK